MGSAKYIGLLQRECRFSSTLGNRLHRKNPTPTFLQRVSPTTHMHTLPQVGHLHGCHHQAGLCSKV